MDIAKAFHSSSSSRVGKFHHATSAINHG